MDSPLSFLETILLYSQDNYFVSILFFFFFLFCYSAISLPGLIIFISISGYLFGMYYGFVISILSITFGSLVFFFLSKTFFKYFFIQYYEKYAQNINKYISNSSIEYLIIFRLMPGPPLMLQNIILSLLDIPIYKFLLSSFLGFIPVVFISVFIGNKIMDVQLIKEITSKDIFTWDFILFISLLLLLLILRIKSKKSN